MKGNRWGHRDATMVLVAFRHGLRASELVDHALLHVRRLKNGSPATHPLTGKELRALRRLQREQELKSPFVFTSERGTPFTRRGFQAMVERAGKAVGFDMTPRLRLQVGQRRRGYQDDPGLSGAQVDPAYGALHRAGTDSVQELVSRLTGPCFGFEIRKGDPSFSSSKIVKYLSH
jgi:hypothetical protein